MQPLILTFLFTLFSYFYLTMWPGNLWILIPGYLIPELLPRPHWPHTGQNWLKNVTLYLAMRHDYLEGWNQSFFLNTYSLGLFEVSPFKKISKNIDFSLWVRQQCGFAKCNFFQILVYCTRQPTSCLPGQFIAKCSIDTFYHKRSFPINPLPTS